MSTPGQRLKRALDVRNVSQHALARDTGLTQGHISRLCSGSRSADMAYETVYKIARRLRITPEWWIFNEGEGPKDDDAIPDPLPHRAEAARVCREGGVPENVLEAVLHDKPPMGSESWTTLRWINFIQLQVSVLGDTIALSPSTAPPHSRMRTRADISARPVLATAKKK